MPSQSMPAFVKLATGGVSEPASAGVSGLASGGVCELASGGVSGLAGGGTSGPASGGAAATVPKRSTLLGRLKLLVTRVREAMAARPLIRHPLTKDALAALEVAMQSEFRLGRQVKRVIRFGASSAKQGPRKKRTSFSRGSMIALRRTVQRRDERIATVSLRP